MRSRRTSKIEDYIFAEIDASINFHGKILIRDLNIVNGIELEIAMDAEN